MLVGDRMVRAVITVPPEMQVIEALSIMKQAKIRRTPVVKDGVLVGIISDKDLLNASPPTTTSLSVWEINYLLSKITVREVMTKNVLTVTENTPIEEAACIMADNKLGGLPVVRGNQIVGIITETDLFKIFLELMGAREDGVRVTAVISDEKGTLARLTQAIASSGGNFIAFGQFTGEKHNTRLVTFKESEITQERLEEIITPIVDEIIDIRTRGS